MGLEKVKQEILDNASKEASGIIEAAQAEARSILKAAEKQAEQNEKEAAATLQKAADAMKKKEAASAELELQKQLLATKSGLIGQAFLDAAQKISSFPEKKREDHIRSLLEAARKEMNVAVVRCNARDIKLADSASGGKLKILREDSITGGIIAESSDGRLRVDYSYDAMLEQARSKVLGDVANALFGK